MKFVTKIHAATKKLVKFCHDVRCREQWGFEVSGGFPRETIPGVNSLSFARWKSSMI